MVAVEAGTFQAGFGCTGKVAVIDFIAKHSNGLGRRLSPLLHVRQTLIGVGHKTRSGKVRGVEVFDLKTSRIQQAIYFAIAITASPDSFPKRV
jgi:hypothetical protein